jgi:hypothetical protein
MEDTKFVKHFARLLCTEEISDEDAIIFFDVVQSIVSTKILTGIDSENAEKVNVDIIVYTSETDDLFVYEIVLNEDIEPTEGDEILRELTDEFEFDFEFEASTEM